MEIVAAAAITWPGVVAPSSLAMSPTPNPGVYSPPAQSRNSKSRPTSNPK